MSARSASETADVVLARAHPLLQCPVHLRPLDLLTTRLRCASCNFEVTCEDGVLVTGEKTLRNENLAQRAMASSLISRIYERLWRPVLMRVVSGFGTAAEDALIARHSGRVPAPAVLELCCGTARALREHVGADGVGLGVDLSLPMLRQARRRVADGQVMLLHGNAERPLARDASFDLALCFAALHLLDDPERLVAAAARALRPGGTFIAWTLIPAGILHTRFVSTSRLAALGLKPLKPGELQQLAQRAGLSVVDAVIDGALEAVVCERL